MTPTQPAKQTAATRGRKSGRPTSPRAPIRREDILEEASKLFALNGFNETNLKEVADQLGCTRQALYYHFTNKDEIVQELIEMAFTALSVEVVPLLHADLPPIERLERVLREHVRLNLSRKAIYSVYLNRRQVLPTEHFEDVNHRERAYIDEMARVVAQWQRETGKTEPSPMMLTLLALGLCNSTLSWFRPEGPESVDEVAARVAHFAIHGLTSFPVTAAPASITPTFTSGPSNKP
jgi:TetR/AcrR family transcriptional regulator, cholesterol catabolism regulator